ncbi:hypothetical protein D3C74_209560 [compost metagenome]
MKNKKIDIERNIVEIIRNITNKSIKDRTTNLFEDIDVFEILYILVELERKMHITMGDLFENSDYTVMTIENLTEKIYLNDKLTLV